MSCPSNPQYPAHVWPVARDAQGRPNRCLVACGQCGKEQSWPRFPVDITAQYLTQRGYENPGDTRRCACPACVADGRKSYDKSKRADDRKMRAITDPLKPQTVKPKEALLMSAASISPTAKPKADAPRTPTPAENQRIHEELLANWDTKRACYTGALNDAVMAERLKMPRAWVSAVRVMFCGEADTCAAKLDAPLQLNALKAEAKKLEGDALDIAARAEALGKKVADIQKAVG